MHDISLHFEVFSEDKIQLYDVTVNESVSDMYQFFYKYQWPRCGCLCFGEYVVNKYVPIGEVFKKIQGFIMDSIAVSNWECPYCGKNLEEE